jgi:rare lipoprotein A
VSIRAVTSRGALLAALALAACGEARGPAPAPRYVVGEPYQAGGLWRYPREQFDYLDTGLAVVAAPKRGGLTANGEAWDGTALAAGHRTLQLPAIARVTNLETGRSLLVRINDRGPEAPGRLIELTPRAATLLGGTAGAPFQVRVQLLEAESRALAGAGSAPPPMLAVAAAPRGGVQAETLAPPPGARESSRIRTAATGPAPVVAALAAPVTVPERLPEQVAQTSASPGLLYVECGSFSSLHYARLMQGNLATLQPEISTDYNAPRDRAFRVRLGPARSPAEADALLDRALRAGVSDARIVVDKP